MRTSRSWRSLSGTSCALLGKIYVDCVELFSIAAPFLVMVVYQKEVSMPA